MTFSFCRLAFETERKQKINLFSKRNVEESMMTLFLLQTFVDVCLNLRRKEERSCCIAQRQRVDEGIKPQIPFELKRQRTDSCAELFKIYMQFCMFNERI